MEAAMLDNVDGVEGVSRATGLADGGGNFAERLDKSCLNLSRFLVPTGSPGMLPDNTPGVDSNWADERSTGT
jgi:hypothetical protein